MAEQNIQHAVGDLVMGDGSYQPTYRRCKTGVYYAVRRTAKYSEHDPRQTLDVERKGARPRDATAVGEMWSHGYTSIASLLKP